MALEPALNRMLGMLRLYSTLLLLYSVLYSALHHTLLNFAKLCCSLAAQCDKLNNSQLPS